MTMVTQVADLSAEVTRYLRVRELLTPERPAQVSADDVRSVAAILAAMPGAAPGQLEVWQHDGVPVVEQPRGPGWAPLAVRDESLALPGGICGLGTSEGHAWRLSLSPGVVGLRTFDARAQDRDRESLASAATGYAVDDLGYPAALGYGASWSLPWPETAPSAVITGWSAKSRAAMVRAVGSLDLSCWSGDDGEAVGMVTLTAPADWLAVFPTGREFKRAVRVFTERFRKAYGPVRGIWKLEFQHRGAPHLHVLMRVPVLGPSPFCEECDHTADHLGYPVRLGYGHAACRCWTFERWLAWTWADVVDADGLEWVKHLRAGTGVDFDTRRYSDPRRISLYFLGHSAKSTDSKEYQHVVPDAWQGPGAGPGRFWGYWGLDRAEVEVDLGRAEWYAVRRVLRHVGRARSAAVAVQRAEHDLDSQGYPYRLGYGRRARSPRGLRSLGSRGGTGGGWVLVNDGLRLGLQVGKFLASRRA